MKRLLTIFLALLMLLTLASCGKGDASASQEKLPQKSGEAVESAPSVSQPTAEDVGEPYTPKEIPPLCWTWRGQDTEGRYLYELTIHEDDTFVVSCHDVAICSGVSEGNLTWRTGGTMTAGDDIVAFEVSNEGDSVTIEYSYCVEGDDLLVLHNTEQGYDRLFNEMEIDPENDGDLFFWRFVPDAAYLAQAFVFCDAFDYEKAKEEQFWEILSAAMSTVEDVSENGYFAFDESVLLQYEYALFGEESLEIQGTGIKLEDDLYYVPVVDGAGGYSAHVLEASEDAVVISFTDDKNETVYLRVGVELSQADVGFNSEITGITRLRVSESEDKVQAANAVTTTSDFSGQLESLTIDYYKNGRNCYYSLGDGVLSVQAGEWGASASAEQALSAAELAEITTLIQSCGLREMNGYGVWLNGLPYSAGQVSVSAKFSSGGLLSFRGNGGNEPDGFDDTFRQISECVGRLSGVDCSALWERSVGSHTFSGFTEPNINMAYTVDILSMDKADVTVEGYQTNMAFPARLENDPASLRAYYDDADTELFKNGDFLFALIMNESGDLRLVPEKAALLWEDSMEEQA